MAHPGHEAYRKIVAELLPLEPHPWKTETEYHPTHPTGASQVASGISTSFKGGASAVAGGFPTGT